MNVTAPRPQVRTSPADVPVWDIVVRLFHWCLVATITVAMVTGFLLGKSWVTVHLVAGVSAAALVGVRIVWGLLGPGPARFASFVHGPVVVLAHAREVLAGHARRHLGHNPLGGAMIVTLLCHRACWR